MATEYKDPAVIPSLEEAVQKWVETSVFAEIKGTDPDTIRQAGRKGQLECTKLFGTLLFKKPEFSEKNEAWQPSEGSSSRAREDGRRRYDAYFNDEEAADFASLYPDAELKDPRVKRASKKAEASATDAGTVESEDTLDFGGTPEVQASSNPFAALSG